MIENIDMESDVSPWNERSPRLETYRVVFSGEMRSLATVRGRSGVWLVEGRHRGGTEKWIIRGMGSIQSYLY